MQAATLMIAAATVSLAIDGVTTSTVECEADHECSNGYCYLPTRICTLCTNCLVYLRKPPSWKACPKSAQECGDCVAGFQDDILTDGTKRSFCVALDLLPPDNLKYYALGGVSFVFLSSIIFLVFWKFKKGSALTRGNHTTIPTVEDPPPPPYNGSAPLLNARYEISDERIQILEIDGRKEAYPLQQAVPFADAVPPFNRNDVGHHFGDDDLDQEDDFLNAYLPSSPPLDDEETVPSTWSPEVSSIQAVGGSETLNQPQRDPAFPSEHNEHMPTSSTSSLSEHTADDNNDDDDDDDDGSQDQRCFNDSGLSASCSQQSSSISLNARPFIQFSSNANTASSAVPQRCQSEEDVNANYQPSCKKAKRDSGSASMASVTPDNLEDAILSGIAGTGQESQPISL